MKETSNRNVAPQKGSKMSSRLREEALHRLGDGDNVTAVAQWAGVHRATVSRWARSAGINPSAKAHQTRAATTVRVAELAAATVNRLEALIDVTTEGLLHRLTANAAAAALHIDDVDTPVGRAVVAHYQRIADLEPTRDLVGALTRAIHDLDLLRGKAAESGNLVIQFGIPRPVDDGDVLDVPAMNP